LKYLNYSSPEVLISARALKHIYEARPTHKYRLILNSIANVIENPVRLYRNAENNTAQFILVGLVIGEYLAVCLGSEQCIITAFTTRESYLKKYKLLWTREDGTLQS
jgi:hypothetical protein